MSTSKDYKTLAFMHNAPRFWHTNNIAVLASQGERSRRDYVNGIIAFAIFLLCLFSQWAIVMIYFKIRGVKNYGYMAGQVTFKTPHRRRTKTVDENEEVTAYRRYQKIQSIFIISTFGLIISCILFLRKGLPYLDQATIDIKELNFSFRYTILEGIDIASLTNQRLQEIQDSIATLSNITDVNNYCLTQNGLDDFNVTFYRDGLIDNMRGVQDFVTTHEVDALSFNLNAWLQRSYSADKALDLYASWDWIGKMSSMVIIVLTLFLMMYTVFRIFSISNYAAESMVKYFVLPSFILALTIGWIITVIYAEGSTMNSDFCYGDGVDGPEATVQDALHQYGISDGHIILNLFLYYKNECAQENTWEVEITKIISYLQSGITTVDYFLSHENQMQNICGERIMSLVNSFKIAKQQMKKLSFAFERGIGMTQCERIMPLYRRLFNGTSCKESLVGLSWAFYSMLALSCFGMILVSFRAALYEMKVVCEVNNVIDDILHKHEEDIIEDWKEKQSIHRFENPSQQNQEIHSQITFTVSDEDFVLPKERETYSLSPTTVHSNQSTIDSNECFRDDEVNSFNDELEPLTPSPRISSHSSTDRTSSFFP